MESSLYEILLLVVIIIVIVIIIIIVVVVVIVVIIIYLPRLKPCKPTSYENIGVDISHGVGVQTSQQIATKFAMSLEGHLGENIG
nr:hypothetical protein BaRGS_023257 [Batillaria attramentaria]